MKFQNTLIERLAGYAAVVAILVTCAFVFSTTSVHANPSYFVRANQTSTVTTGPTTLATTTRTWQTGGMATSTITLNTNIGTLQSVDSLTLKLYRLAAGGTTQTNVQIEYSANCDAVSPDWYSAATTSAQIAASIPTGFFTTGQASAKLTWQFASSTIGGSPNVLNFDTLIIPVPIYERCVRAVMTTPIGAASSSIYTEFVGKRENN